MKREEILKILTAVFQDVFDDETLMVTEDTSADDIDGWDSLAHISLIAAIESEFGIRFDIKTALKLKSAAAIADAVSALKQ